MPTTDTHVDNLVINVLTEQQYSQIQNPSQEELYLVPDVVDTVPTENSQNTITSGAVYDALQNSQADWDASDSDDPSFILNKPDLATVATSGNYNDLTNKPTIPTVPEHRTINHETIIGDTDANIHDGYYFPNAVTDLDGYWYGAVVIGDQVWLAENLRTTKYPSSGDEIFIDEVDDAGVGYCFPMLDELGGFYYNWTATMDGSSDSNNAPSGVQGIAPTGFHIPSQTEFENLVKYLETQERYNDSIAKSVAATSGWTTNQLPGYPSWPSVELENNNATGFNSRQGGYYFGGGLNEEESAFYWTTTIGDGGNPVYYEIPNEDSSISVGEADGFETFCAVRCVSDLNPVQFRDWYVNEYGTMQHHLARNGILNTTLTTSQTISSNESLGGTVRLHKVSKTGSYNDLLDTPDLSASLYEEITYSSLLTKVGNSQLVKGKMYRITDYETTTTQQNTYSAGHPFDLVVTAISTNELDHRASALERAGDTYFYTAKSDLRKWQIWYDVYNTDTIYPWADETNGKGVIYRMIDEYGNEAPYDFKNIQFENVSMFGQGRFYTFSYYDNGTIKDFSLRGSRCHDNVIKKSESGLNFIVLYNGDAYENCYDNKFDYDCVNNYLVSTIDVTFGQRCSTNTISQYCNNIHFGDDCESNMLYADCKDVVFGDFCCNNNLQYGCSVIEFGNTCTYIDLSTSYCNNIRVGNSNDHIRIYNSTNPGANNVLKNIYIVQGFNHSSNNTYTDISTISRNLNYRTTVGRQTDGSVRIYNEEDEVLSVPYATQAGSVDYPLHIGPHDYDGSAEVFVDIYDSDYYFSSDYHGGGGATTLGELTDTNLLSLRNGEVLTYENGVWKNESVVKRYYASVTGNVQSGFTVGGVYDLTGVNPSVPSISTISTQIQEGRDVKIMCTTYPGGRAVPFYTRWLYPMRGADLTTSKIYFCGFDYTYGSLLLVGEVVSGNDVWTLEVGDRSVLSCFVTSKTTNQTTGAFEYKLNRSPKEICDAAYAGNLVVVYDKTALPSEYLSVYTLHTFGHGSGSIPGSIEFISYNGNGFTTLQTGPSSSSYTSLDTVWNFNSQTMYDRSQKRFSMGSSQGQHTIDVSLLNNNLFQKTMKVPCYLAYGNTTTTIDITGYSGDLYLRNSNDLTLSPGQVKVLTITVLEGDCFIESYETTLTQTGGGNGQAQ